MPKPRPTCNARNGDHRRRSCSVYFLHNEGRGNGAGTYGSVGLVFPRSPRAPHPARSSRLIGLRLTRLRVQASKKKRLVGPGWSAPGVKHTGWNSAAGLKDTRAVETLR